MARDYVDEDISRAFTLHSDYYTNPELFEKIKTSFSNHWHFAVHSSEFDDVNMFGEIDDEMSFSRREV
mgnify:CR=1 FL=1